MGRHAWPVWVLLSIYPPSLGVRRHEPHSPVRYPGTVGTVRLSSHAATGKSAPPLRCSLATHAAPLLTPPRRLHNRRQPGVPLQSGRRPEDRESLPSWLPQAQLPPANIGPTPKGPPGWPCRCTHDRGVQSSVSAQKRGLTHTRNKTPQSEQGRSVQQCHSCQSPSEH